MDRGGAIASKKYAGTGNAHVNAILARRYEIHDILLIKNILLLLCDYASPRAMGMNNGIGNDHPIPIRYPPWPIQ